MANTIPVKQDIFSFVTLRAPNKGVSQDFETLLVYHPDLPQSYWAALPQDPRQGEQLILQLINNFPAYKSEQELKTIFGVTYSLAMETFRKNFKISDNRLSGATPLTTQLEIDLFDQVIYQVLAKQSPPLRESMAQVLATNQAIKNHNTQIQFDKNVSDIKVVIPGNVIEIIQPVFHKNCDGELHGVINLGIADYRRVEQEVCCYVPGEVSHIENVMAREYKERSTRNLVRTEETVETSRETEIENLTDTTTATRHELSTEVAKVLDDMKTNDYGGSLGVNANWGTYNMNANFAANFSSSSASSLSNMESKQFAEEVTTKALERIVQKTSEKRSSKIIKEFEEQYKHGFDNREGDEHVTGIYRWIDIIYKNRLVNYGKRLMVEFMVPEPAEFYKRISKYKPTDPESEEDTLPEPPKMLSDFGITKPSDITTTNVYTPASYYGVSVDTLPTGTLDLTKDLSPLAPVKHNRNTNTQSLTPINVPP